MTDKEKAVREIAKYVNLKQVYKLWFTDYKTMLSYLSWDTRYKMHNRYDDFYVSFSRLRDIIDENLDILSSKKVKKDLQYRKKSV